MPQKVKLFYLRNLHGHPVAAVASTLLEDGKIKFAVATRNPLDNFNKERGRGIAVARLNSDKFTGVVDGGMGVKTRVLENIYKNKEMPQRTRQAAGYWLGVSISAAGL
jgi:hypothetical protein